ncbi:hypothetical protein ACWFRK_35100 [Streptomyces sp. NPDC055157]
MSDADTPAADEQHAPGWQALWTLYSHVEARLDNALQSRHGLSLREYCLQGYGS